MYNVNRATYPDVFRNRATRALNAQDITAKVPAVQKLSTIEFEIETGSPYLDIKDVLKCLWEAARSEFQLLRNIGLSPFLFEMSATLTPERAVEVFGPRVIRSLRSKYTQMLGQGRGVEFRFEVGRFVKGGALLPLSPERLLDAIIYSNMKTYSLIILSPRKDFCSEANLKQIFRLASIDFNGKLSNIVNEGLISALVCPLGDVVVKTHGEFDDTGRDLQFIFDPEKREELLSGGS